MIALLSPAKTLDFSAVETASTDARLLDHAESLVKKLRRRSIADLQEMMSISEDLAKLNKQRYKDFERPFTPTNAKPALLAFKGDVYQGLEADTMTEAEIDFAQDHLRILSGLYGLLRPRDLMQAYRLEMGTKLANRKGKDLYAFWGDEITELLNEDLRRSGAELVLNLASKEYFESLNTDKLIAPVLDIDFREDRNGKLKFITYNAKKARGRMARLMIQERITKAEDLKSLDVDGYVYSEDHAQEGKWLFVK
ncbi:MAG: peroxide stress protein YaaA [Bacteroidota bacterium]